jgi:hypothetical protein
MVVADTVRGRLILPQVQRKTKMHGQLTES